MAQEQQTFDISTYIDIAIRRKWYIIVPLVLSVITAFGVYKTLPKIYRATTLILVSPQSTSDYYVRPTITGAATNQVNTISQQILSDTHLEKVIQDLNLSPDQGSSVSMEDVIESLRRAIEIKIEGKDLRNQFSPGQITFSMSYEGKEPRKVMEITNKLATLFIEENRKTREQHAERTSDLFSQELKSIEDRMKKQEEAIRTFKERKMGELPEQFGENLRTVERLEMQLQVTTQNIRSAEDRSTLLKNQIAQIIERERTQTSRTVRKDPLSGTEQVINENEPEPPLITEYKTLQKELAAAQLKYTESHPDVINLRRRIAALESQVREIVEHQKEAVKTRLAELKSERDRAGVNSLALPLSNSFSEGLVATYSAQYNQAVLEVKSLKEEEANLKRQIALYRRRIEDTPNLEQELARLTRDYDQMKANYASLIEKRVEAQMAENLERKQQDERFRVIDPGRVPVRPVRPNLMKLLLSAIFFGLVSAIGSIWLLESMDKSFRTVAEVEGYLGVPVLVSIPNLKEEKGPSYYPRGKKVA